MKSISHCALDNNAEIAFTYEKTKSTGQRHNRSSKCSLALITAAQRRDADQLDRSRSSAAPGAGQLLLIDLQAIYLFNMLAIWCNLCAICAFRPTWSWLQRRPNDTELKISVHARHTRPSNVTGKKSTERQTARETEKTERRPLDLCKWIYVWIWTTEITQNTFGTECMAIALTFSRVCSFDVTQKSEMTMIRSFPVPLDAQLFLPFFCFNPSVAQYMFKLWHYNKNKILNKVYFNSKILNFFKTDFFKQRFNFLMHYLPSFLI